MERDTREVDQNCPLERPAENVQAYDSELDPAISKPIPFPGGERFFGSHTHGKIPDRLRGSFSSSPRPFLFSAPDRRVERRQPK